MQRLLWAAGYHVPDNEVIDISQDELVIAPDARRKDEVGDEHPFTAADLQGLLARRPRGAGGRLRVLASSASYARQF